MIKISRSQGGSTNCTVIHQRSMSEIGFKVLAQYSILKCNLKFCKITVIVNWNIEVNHKVYSNYHSTFMRWHRLKTRADFGLPYANIKSSNAEFHNLSPVCWVFSMAFSVEITNESRSLLCWTQKIERFENFTTNERRCYKYRSATRSRFIHSNKLKQRTRKKTKKLWNGIS